MKRTFVQLVQIFAFVPCLFGHFEIVSAIVKIEWTFISNSPRCLEDQLQSCTEIWWVSWVLKLHFQLLETLG